MPTRPDQSHAMAAKQAKSPDVAEFFQILAGRAETYARMQDDFLESIVRHREARTGKPFRHTKRQEGFLECFDADAVQAEKDIESVTARMDDRTLLVSAISSECQQLELDAAMASSYRPEDREMAERMIEFRRETIRLIEGFVEGSRFKGQVASIWHAKTKNENV